MDPWGNPMAPATAVVSTVMAIAVGVTFTLPFVYVFTQLWS